MKQLRSLGAAYVLALMLTIPASAGHIETGITSPQPSPSPASAVTAEDTDTGNVAGHIETGVTSSDTLAEAALNLINSLLALF